MAAKKSAKKASKKSSTKKPGTRKSASKKAASKKAASKTPRAGAKKTASKPRAAARGGTKSGASAKPSGKTPLTKKAGKKLLTKAKEIAGDVLKGAALGALAGAVKAGAEDLGQAADTMGVEQPRRSGADQNRSARPQERRTRR